MVHFVGAGSGAADLITVRGQRLLREADVIIYTGSLVNPELLNEKKPDCVCYNSAHLTLEEVVALMRQAHAQQKETVRLHTGDPCLYGAVREQMDALDALGIAYDDTPGVSSFCGAAAALRMEYTLPGVSQSVIITRMAGRTPVPDQESIERLASHQATMVIFLSAGMLEELAARLLAGGYAPDTPAAIVYKATWPEEETYVTCVRDLAETAAAHGIAKTALVIVGKTVAQRGYTGSFLYDPSFETGYRAAGVPQPDYIEKKGKLYVVGIGPGAREMMTQQAIRALEKSSVVIGYTTYIDLIQEYCPGKTFLSAPMRQGVSRCELALRTAAQGTVAAVVCSGDGGVYGMSGLILELAQQYPQVEIEIISGVTAATAGASVLGAPLMHDFALVSLSDWLTPWEIIEQRLRHAAQADFVICLYNPSSKSRADYLKRACAVVLEWQKPDTVCGIVENIGRNGQAARILTLEALRDTAVNMFTTVWIGNSKTKVIAGKMVTPRGYRLQSGMGNGVSADE